MYEMSYKCSMYQLKLFHLNTLPKNIRKTHTIGFLYKNKLVYKEDTPRSLGIKSDDFIEVFLVKKKDKVLLLTTNINLKFPALILYCLFLLLSNREILIAACPR